MEDQQIDYIWGGCLIALAIILVFIIPYWNTLTESVQGWIAFFILALGFISIIRGQMKGRKKLRESRAKESIGLK